MGFATVKSSKWPNGPRPMMAHLWSERHWRSLVLSALLEIADDDLRQLIATSCSFRFKKRDLATTNGAA